MAIPSARTHVQVSISSLQAQVFRPMIRNKTSSTVSIHVETQPMDAPNDRHLGPPGPGFSPHDQEQNQFHRLHPCGNPTHGCT